MQGRKLIAFGVFALAVTLALMEGVALADQHSGTWKLNTAKTKYSPGPAPQSMTLKVESDATSYKLIADGVDGTGKSMHVEYSGKFDGKDYPSVGSPYGDTVSLKRIDANTVEVTNKKDGQATVTVTSVISKDGKTRTSTFKGKSPEGHEVNNVAVYEKQ